MGSIAKISNNRLILIVLSVSCVGMVGLTTIENERLHPFRTAVGYLLMPVQTGVNRVGNAIYTNFKNQERMRTALSDNESLRKQVASLTMENTRLQNGNYELRRLRALYELNQTYGQYRMTGTRVIAKDTGNWFHMLRIGKGARDGIKPDMGVVGDGGPVGIVTDVDDNYATVRSIIDDASCVNAMAVRSGNTCIASGSLQLHASGKLKFSDITDTADIKDSNAIMTSTVSSKFLPGILIGYVGDLKTDLGHLTRSGTLVPIADFKTIQDMLAVFGLESEMREDGSLGTPRTTLPDAGSLTAPETTASEGGGASEADTTARESTAEDVAAESSVIEASVAKSSTAAPETSTATVETTARDTTAAIRTTAATQRKTTAARRRTERQTEARETHRREAEASAERRRQGTGAPRQGTQVTQPPETQATQTEPTQTVESLSKNPWGG